MRQPSVLCDTTVVPATRFREILRESRQKRSGVPRARCVRLNAHDLQAHLRSCVVESIALLHVSRCMRRYGQRLAPNC